MPLHSKTDPREFSKDIMVGISIIVSLIGILLFVALQRVTGRSLSPLSYLFAEEEIQPVPVVVFKSDADRTRARSAYHRPPLLGEEELARVQQLKQEILKVVDATTHQNENTAQANTASTNDSGSSAVTRASHFESNSPTEFADSKSPLEIQRPPVTSFEPRRHSGFQEHIAEQRNRLSGPQVQQAAEVRTSSELNPAEKGRGQNQSEMRPQDSARPRESTFVPAGSSLENPMPNRNVAADPQTLKPTTIRNRDANPPLDLPGHFSPPAISKPTHSPSTHLPPTDSRSLRSIPSADILPAPTRDSSSQKASEESERSAPEDFQIKVPARSPNEELPAGIAGSKTTQTVRKITPRKDDSFWTIAVREYGDGELFRELATYNKCVANSDVLPAIVILPSQATLQGIQVVDEVEQVDPKQILIRPQADKKQTKADALPLPNKSDEHIVKAGETLFEIAKNKLGNGSRFVEILRANSEILTADTDGQSALSPGTILKMPTE